jgi:DNA-directed RNA polymerase subunit RPC12/RpoP
MLKPLESEIGRKQPRLLKLESIAKCMDCGAPFTMMRKKYNCRACGIVSFFVIRFTDYGVTLGSLDFSKKNLITFFCEL